MSYEEDNDSGSDHDFGDLFGSEDEASDIDDGRSQSSQEAPQPTTRSSPPPQAPKANDLDNLFGSDDESGSAAEEEEEETNKRQTLKQRR